MEKDTLKILVRRHQAQIYRYLRYLGADLQEAEDLVQDTFLVAFTARKRPPTNNVRRTSAWLRAIAQNRFLPYCRKKKYDRVIINSDYLEQAEAMWSRKFLHHGDGFDYVEALRECMQTLSQKQRKVLDMRYQKQKSRKEMADIFKITEDGIKQILRRIRTALAECIERRLAKENTV